jgi:hypothetical protein
MPTYEMWQPLSELPSRLQFERMSFGRDGLRVTLSVHPYESTRRMTIYFENPIAFRSTDEGDLLKTLSDHPLLYKTPLAIVRESDYLPSVAIQAATHYSIVTSNECIDVISNKEPEVAWI